MIKMGFGKVGKTHLLQSQNATFAPKTLNKSYNHLISLFNQIEISILKIYLEEGCLIALRAFREKLRRRRQTYFFPLVLRENSTWEFRGYKCSLLYLIGVT